MRIVLKINDDSPLGRFILRRMAETGLEQSTIARSILFQAMRESEAGDPPTIHPRIERTHQPVEQAADGDDSDDDDNAILMGLLNDI